MRVHRQDGFIRELLWVAVIVAVLAVVVLDGLSLFNADRSVEESARGAAREARNTYSQTQDVDAAFQAAEQYLNKGNHDLVAADVTTDEEGAVVFKITAKAHATTYVVKYLKYVGLDGWVNHVSNPVGTGSSS